MAGPVDARGRRRDRGSSFTGSVRRNGEEEATEDLRTSPQQNSAAGLAAPALADALGIFKRSGCCLTCAAPHAAIAAPALNLTLLGLPVRDVRFAGITHASVEPGWACQVQRRLGPALVADFPRRT